MPKPIVEITLEALVPPDYKRTFFEGAEQEKFRFEPKATAYSPRNAWWLAEAAFAAYGVDQHGKFLLDVTPLTTLGYTVCSKSVNGTQLVAISRNDALIIAFCGTQVHGFDLLGTGGRGFIPDVKDSLADGGFIFDQADKRFYPNVLVHKGFLRAFRDIEPMLDETIAKSDQSTALWFCGHSLGGALASIAAYKYRYRGEYSPFGLYTYGSPRVGSDAFVKTLVGSFTNIYRFVHHRDFVTTVPPQGIPIGVNPDKWWNFIKRLKVPTAGYAHFGNLKYIVGGPGFAVLDNGEADSSLAGLASDTFAFLQEVNDVITHGFAPFDPSKWPVAVEAIADHAPVYYANKLFNACEAL